jgi:hypothetical protein
MITIIHTHLIHQLLGIDLVLLFSLIFILEIKLSLGFISLCYSGDFLLPKDLGEHFNF